MNNCRLELSLEQRTEPRVVTQRDCFVVLALKTPKRNKRPSDRLQVIPGALYAFFSSLTTPPPSSCNASDAMPEKSGQSSNTARTASGDDGESVTACT